MTTATDSPSARDSLGNLNATSSIDRTIVPRIREALEGMEFGKITISIKDGQVVQIDRVQQTRVLRRPRS